MRLTKDEQFLLGGHFFGTPCILYSTINIATKIVLLWQSFINKVSIECG